jgi:hypothetical protein
VGADDQQNVKKEGPQNKQEALKKARLVAARKAYDKVWALYAAGRYDEEAIYRWSVRLLESQRALASKRADRVAAVKAHLDRMKELEKESPRRPVLQAKDRVLLDKNGWRLGLAIGASTLNPPDRSDAAAFIAFYVAEGELWLAEANRQP